MVDPRILCRQHLCGEHYEIHALMGCLRRGHSVDGYLVNNLLEPSSLFARHEALKEEMLSRGYNHQSHLDSDECERCIKYLSPLRKIKTIHVGMALADLLNRCQECQARFYRLNGKMIRTKW